VLPLVPAYLAFVSGVGLGEEEARRRDVALPTAAFVTGFAAAFSLLRRARGSSAPRSSATGGRLRSPGGIVVMAMELVLLGRRVPTVLMRDRRLHRPCRPATLAGSGLAGAAFALGWTPCIGPTMAAALTLAARGGRPATGAALLFVYALGLGVPFFCPGSS
jgi:cytochrome c-type biogenesis protein